jgi:hypothetical protein
MRSSQFRGLLPAFAVDGLDSVWGEFEGIKNLVGKLRHYKK